jgi:DNA-binding MarR family transcriptional regulator
MAMPKGVPVPIEQEGAQASSPALALYAVKRLEQAVRARLDEVLRPLGITTLQYTALTVLERHDGLPAAQLARGSFVTAQSTADLVRALERRDLVVRERNPHNRRELLIKLSPAGRQLLADVAQNIEQVERRMMGGLSPKQAEDFRRALTRAWHALA